MPITTRHSHHETPVMFRSIMMLSAWGFVLVAASFLFMWLGYLLDKLLGTSPMFMLGLFFTAIVGCFIELFDEARRIRK